MGDQALHAGPADAHGRADKPLLTVLETRALLGGSVGRDAIYEMVRDGRLPALRIGPRIKIPRVAVERLIESIAASQRLPDARDEGPASGRARDYLTLSDTAPRATALVIARHRE